MSELDDLERAANALRRLGEEEHAANVHEYVNDELGRWPSIYGAVRSVVYWVLIVALLVIGFGGAADLALGSQYFAAVALLLLTVAVYGFLRLSEKLANAIRDHAENEIQETRIKTENVGRNL